MDNTLRHRPPSGSSNMWHIALETFAMFLILIGVPALVMIGCVIGGIGQ